MSAWRGFHPRDMPVFEAGAGDCLAPHPMLAISAFNLDDSLTDVVSTLGLGRDQLGIFDKTIIRR